MNPTNPTHIIAPSILYVTQADTLNEQVEDELQLEDPEKDQAEVVIASNEINKE